MELHKIPALVHFFLKILFCNDEAIDFVWCGICKIFIKIPFKKLYRW